MVFNTNAYKRATYGKRQPTDDFSVYSGNSVPGIGQKRHIRRQSGKISPAIVVSAILLICLCGLVFNSVLQKFHHDERYSDISSSRQAHSDMISHSYAYEHSDVMTGIGNKSYKYAQLRKLYDEELPLHDTDRMKKFVQSLRKREYFPVMEDEMTYDIHDCPFDPPANYPFAWNIAHVLDNWAPDDTTPRSHIYQGLCVFDFETERDKAMHYREAELPFVVRDDPQVLKTTERWNQPGYMDKLLGDVMHRTEYSPNNHFMYWNKPNPKFKKVYPDFKPPTKMMRMKYQEWLSHANITDDSKLGPDMEHWYYRLIGCGEMAHGKCDKGSSEYLFDELAFFQPRIDNDLYMTEPEKQGGIHCRFGMKGVIAENHFDGARNMIALMGGERRYILSHPDQCENLALYPKGHPSARHSAIDWSNPDWGEFPQFENAEVNEIVLQAGDVLYLPTTWFHYIISLELNFQCNTRSGKSEEYASSIHECGF